MGSNKTLTGACVRLAEILGPGGEFVHKIPGFVPRPGQLELAQVIASAIEAREHLVAEAGTGIGKTFAYLVPILTGGRRAVISTATRALQDQIYERDLPQAAAALGRPVEVAVLKGRRNYLCLERYRNLEQDWAGFPGLDRAALAAWVRSTPSGEFSQLPGLGESSPVIQQLSIDRESCLGSVCPEHARCHVYAARRRAQAADVVIVNHHLLIADLTLKAEGFGDLLGQVDVVVVDEAHTLPETARMNLGETVSLGQVKDLLGDLNRLPEMREGGSLRRALVAAEAALSVLPYRLDPPRRAWSEVATKFTPGVSRLLAAIHELIGVLEPVSEREALLERARELARHLVVYADETPVDIRNFSWVEQGAHGNLVFRRTPLEIGLHLDAWRRAGQASWIFTSATLSVAGQFAAILRELGLDAARTLQVQSPFRHAEQGLLYLPRGLAPVHEKGYTEGVLREAVPLIRAAGGGCFLLFTSWNACRRAALWLRAEQLGYPLFVQGEAPRGYLLETFRAVGNGLLLGTASFWEGVDVKGDALVLVIIDRLPFASPADPLFAARLEYCRSSGGRPFVDIQLPEAVMALKQGAGRLIRGESDRGVLMIADPRLSSRPYGKAFLESLPPFARTRDQARAEAFLQQTARGMAACV